MIELTTDTLQEVIKENKYVIVQYGASWCGNCRIIKPKFKRLAKENEAITFVYVDAEKLPESRSLATVSNLPTFAGFANGALVSQQAGNKEEIIKNIINEVTNN